MKARLDPSAWNAWFEERQAELRGLDRENIGSWPRWVLGSLLAMALVLGFFVMYQFQVGGLVADLHRSHINEQRARKGFEQTYREAARLPQAEAESETIQGQYKTALQRLPDHIDSNAVKAELERLMQETGVLGQGYTGGTDVIAGAIYDEQRFSYEMQGSYGAFAQLFTRLANWPRLIIPQDFTVQWLSASNDQDLKVKATFSAFAYRPSSK